MLTYCILYLSQSVVTISIAGKSARAYIWPPELSLSVIGFGCPANTQFFESPWVHVPNGISVPLAVLAQLTLMTDRQTDDAAS